MESLCEIQRRRRLLDKKLIWTRQAQVVDEIKRRKKKLNSMRSEFNAYRWKSRREWANKNVIDLQKAEESHDHTPGISKTRPNLEFGKFRG